MESITRKMKMKKKLTLMPYNKYHLSYKNRAHKSPNDNVKNFYHFWMLLRKRGILIDTHAYIYARMYMYTFFRCIMCMSFEHSSL